VGKMSTRIDRHDDRLNEHDDKLGDHDDELRFLKGLR
jgi:hypothetical protein